MENDWTVKVFLENDKSLHKGFDYILIYSGFSEEVEEMSRKNSKVYLNLPCIPKQEKYFISPRKVLIYEFYAISDGCSLVYKDKDVFCEVAKQEILDPREISYMNLFINGVLQPYENYIVKKGEIRLKTVDVPIKGAPIILQMVKVL